MTFKNNHAHEWNDKNELWCWGKKKKKRLGKDFNDETGSHKNGNWAWND